jgi:hypothetical protein
MRRRRRGQTAVAAEAEIVGLDRHVGLLGCAWHVCVTRIDPTAVPSTYSASSSQEAHVEAPAATKRVHFAQHCTTGIVCNDMHDAYALHLCYSAPLSIDKAGLRDKAWWGLPGSGGDNCLFRERCWARTAGGGRAEAAARLRSRIVIAAAAAAASDTHPVPTISARRTVGAPITARHTPVRVEDPTV